VEEDEAMSVKVVDEEGAAIAGATVIVDAERRNWARTATTDAQGAASIIPYRTKTGRHMVRVTMPDMMPTEVRELPEQRPITVMLEPAATYSGTVLGQDDEPLSSATVSIRVDYTHSTGLWTRRDATVLTDAQGRWECPP